MEEIKLLGSRITKIAAERNQDFSGKLEINTNIRIKNMEKVKEAKDSLKIEYDLAIDYGELGKISIEGILFISANSKIIKELQKAWKEKKFDTEEQVQITNIIIKKASIKAFELEDELGLPLHINLPTLNLKK